MIYTRVDQLRIFRGDTVHIDATIRDGDAIQFVVYNVDPKDEIYFALTEPNQMWETAIVKKKFMGSEYSNNVTLESKDTMRLHSGKYYYQLKLRRANGEVHTLNPKTLLYIQ